MDALEPAVLAAGTGGVDVIDVLSVPTIGAAVLSHLRSKSALRRTCSAICALVDQHVEALKIVCTRKKDVYIAGKLARRARRPKHLIIVGSHILHLSSALEMLLASKQLQPMLQCVQQLTFERSFPKNVQPDVFESMPLLTHLVIAPELLSGHTWAEQSYLAAIRVKSLRSLTVRVDQCHAWLLEACTHIKALTLLAYSFEGASAIAQLTGLTQLKLTWTANCEQVFPAAEQSELGRALAALSNLRSLDISHAPPGPVAQALSQLTGLTEVTLHNQGLVPDPGHLTLPGCVQLSFILRIPLQHLACINAPQLQHLDVSLKLGWKPSSEQLDTVRWLSSGILRACSSLSLDLQYNWSGSEVMSVLGQDWQPSADALPPIRPSSNGIERGSSSDVGRQWSLELCHGRCSRQCLELLPKGLTSLYLRDCSLDSDSLEPLAQLASLRVLGLYECRRDFDGLEYLFSTSVQGCLLKVRVSRHWGYERLAQECFEMRQRVLAKRGSRDTPVLA